MAEMKVQAHLEQVWDVLTKYEELPSFVPNLDHSEVIQRHHGRVHLKQIACSQSILWRLEAQAELEIEEVKRSPSEERFVSG